MLWWVHVCVCVYLWRSIMFSFSISLRSPNVVAVVVYYVFEEIFKLRLQKYLFEHLHSLSEEENPTFMNFIHRFSETVDLFV